MCLLSYIHYNLRSFFELCFDLAGRLEIPVDFWPTSILAAGNSDPEQTQTAKSSQLRVPIHYDGVLQSYRKNNLAKFDLFVINCLCRWLFFLQASRKMLASSKELTLALHDKQSTGLIFMPPNYNCSCQILIQVMFLLQYLWCKQGSCQKNGYFTVRPTVRGGQS